MGEGQELLKGRLKIITTADGYIVAFTLQRHKIEAALPCDGGDAEADVCSAILNRQRHFGLAAGGRQDEMQLTRVDPVGSQQMVEEQTTPCTFLAFHQAQV